MRTSFSFQHIDVENGLSQGSISAILQDHYGFMWFGTYDGLNRFDGVEFRVYRHDPEDSTSIPENRITLIVEDNAHTLWVGTQRGGLCRFDRAGEKFERIRLGTDNGTSSTNYTVFSLLESRIGGASMLVAGTPFLAVFDKGQQMLCPVPLPATGHPSAPPEPAIILAQGTDGRPWVGGANGLYPLDPLTMKTGDFLSVPGEISAIVEPRDISLNALWVGTYGELFKIVRSTGKILRRWPLSVSALCEDHRGRIWIGTNKGVFLMTGEPGIEEPVQVASDEPGSGGTLGNNNVHGIFEDLSGSLWFGTYSGLDRLDEHEPSFLVYRHQAENSNSLADDFVMPIAEDGHGNIWFGTFGGGVSILHQAIGHPASFTHLKHDSSKPASLCSDNVRCFAFDGAGSVWIGTSKGLCALDPRTGVFSSFYTTPFRHAQFWTEALCESREGEIWATTPEEGLMKITRPAKGRESAPSTANGPEEQSRIVRGIQFTRYMTEVGLGESHFVMEDRRGRLWIGLENGLVRFDPRSQTVVRYVHRPEDPFSLTNSNIWSVFEDPMDSAEALWVGTNEGLNKLDVKTGKCVRYWAQEGFPSSCVYGILQDDRGRLWLSTNHGLTCFDDSRPEGRKFENFDVAYGLQGNEFNRRSFCRLRCGECLFGGTHGVTRFNPAQIQDNPYVPPVALIAFTKFGRKVEFSRDPTDVSSIELNHDETSFAFEFAALNFTNAAKNQYAYMMEGIDEDWFHCGNRRYASYTHLPPGTYAFRVKASNNTGIWNEKGMAIQVHIRPPFWATWWFISLSMIAAAGGLLAAYRRRIMGLEKEKHAQHEFSMRLMESQELERRRIAGELHDSLGQDLLVVRNRALMGLKDAGSSGNIRDQLDQITSVATQAIDHVREISYNLRPYQLDRLGLTKTIMSLASAVAEASSIRFSMDIVPIDEEIGQDQAIHVYRIIQEAFNNILKHSGATEAHVRAEVVGKDVRITISDNGTGTPEVPPGSAHGKSGFGLIGITERAKAMNGTATIDSKAGKGTTLTVVIPGGRKPA